MNRILLFVVAVPLVVAAFSFVKGISNYLSGTAVLESVGRPGFESENVDPLSRVHWSSSGCLVNGTELLTHLPNNVAIELMATLFGPMRGSYRGPYVSRQQAREALRLSEDVLNFVGAFEHGELGRVQDCRALRQRFPPEEPNPVMRCAVFEETTLILGYEGRAVLRDRETGRIYARYQSP